MSHQDIAEIWQQAQDTVAAMSADGGLWRHYRGGTVRIIGPCLSEDKLEPCVLYEHDGVVWCRTLRAWNEMAVYDCQVVQRFTRMEAKT